LLNRGKRTPNSVVVEMNRSHKELNEKALGEDDQTGRADAVEPVLRRSSASRPPMAATALRRH
jgi:hypothetical protein